MKRAFKLLMIGAMLVTLGCQRTPSAQVEHPGNAHAVPASAPQATPATPPAPGVTVHEVAIRDFAYQPETLTIRVGEGVRWTNYDAAPHDAVANEGGWKTRLLKVNESATQVFSEPGSYPYYCTVHPAMRGTVEVR